MLSLQSVCFQILNKMSTYISYLCWVKRIFLEIIFKLCVYIFSRYFLPLNNMHLDIVIK